MRNKLRFLLLSFIFIITSSYSVFAMENISVDVSFSFTESEGTAIIESVNGAPLPEITEIEDIADGVFTILYDEPGDYKYQIYQKIGADENITYDTTVYNVHVSVFTSDNGDLYSVVTLSIGGDEHKAENVCFKNVRMTDYTVQTGDNSPIHSYIIMCGISLLMLCMIFLYKYHLIKK